MNEEEFWSDLIWRVNNRKIIPIISNSLCIEQVFDQINLSPQKSSRLYDTVHGTAALWTIENQISEAWAQAINYPLPDCHELVRVAQYNYHRVQGRRQRALANRDFLRFLKLYLLERASQCGQDPQLLYDLKQRAADDYCTFSYLANELNPSPYFDTNTCALHILASLPLPIYITTSCHDFLERALLNAGKKPFTQVCFWPEDYKSEPYYENRFLDKCTFLPTSNKQFEYNDTDRPLVYHLYGLERFPDTLVLSEDDYIEYVIRITQDNDDAKNNGTANVNNSNDRKVPLKLYSAISSVTLLLLGYRLQDWDLRILFRGIIGPHRNKSDNFIIQLAPDFQYQIQTVQQASTYLERYFDQEAFRVRWGDSNSFLSGLWKNWKA